MLYWLGRDKAVTWILSGLFVGGGGGWDVYHLCTPVYNSTCMFYHIDSLYS